MAELHCDARAESVFVTNDMLELTLGDGRRIAAPLAWFPALAAASPAARSHWRISAAGYGVYWPDLDEDIGVAGLLRTNQ